MSCLEEDILIPLQKITTNEAKKESKSKLKKSGSQNFFSMKKKIGHEYGYGSEHQIFKKQLKKVKKQEKDSKFARNHSRFRKITPKGHESSLAFKSKKISDSEKTEFLASLKKFKESSIFKKIPENSFTKSQKNIKNQNLIPEGYPSEIKISQIDKNIVNLEKSKISLNIEKIFTCKKIANQILKNRGKRILRQGSTMDPDQFSAQQLYGAKIPLKNKEKFNLF